MHNFKKLEKVLKTHKIPYSVIHTEEESKIQFSGETLGISFGISVSDSTRYSENNILGEDFTIETLEKFLSLRKAIKKTIGKKDVHKG